MINQKKILRIYLLYFFFDSCTIILNGYLGNEKTMFDYIIYVMHFFIHSGCIAYIYFIIALIIELKYSFYYLNLYLNSLCYKKKQYKLIEEVKRTMVVYNFLYQIGNKLDKLYYSTTLYLLFLLFCSAGLFVFIIAILLKDNVIIDYFLFIQVIILLLFHYFEMGFLLYFCVLTKRKVNGINNLKKYIVVGVFQVQDIIISLQKLMLNNRNLHDHVNI